MGNGVRGPICSTRVGDDWVDNGTLCRTKSAPPGHAVGVVVADPAKAAFDGAHGYSLAPEARRKRAIDLEIIGGDYTKSGDIRIDNEDYLRKLISIASGGKQTVRSKAGGMQFFIVRGGAEGLFEGRFNTDLRTIDANTNVRPVIDYDENDLLAVFDAAGGLIGSVRLRRPTRVDAPGGVHGVTADRVLRAWDGKNVYIYRNRHPGWVPYLGLALDDGFRDGSANKGKTVRIDMHKQEQTLGCIFIVDENTPALGEAALHTFEPALIKKILAAKGIDETTLATENRVNLGVMKVVTITLK